MTIAISQVVDHDMYSDKIRVHFFANCGQVSFKVSTLFSRDNLEEFWEYQKTVHKVFNTVAKQYFHTMENRIV